jgi:hypothetical protein
MTHIGTSGRITDPTNIIMRRALIIVPPIAGIIIGGGDGRSPSIEALATYSRPGEWLAPSPMTFRMARRRWLVAA